MAQRGQVTDPTSHSLDLQTRDSHRQPGFCSQPTAHGSHAAHTHNHVITPHTAHTHAGMLMTLAGQRPRANLRKAFTVSINEHFLFQPTSHFRSLPH